MKQLIQDMKTGDVKVVEVPAPRAQAGTVLIRNAWSLVSAGTEKTSITSGRKNLVERALERPDLVRKVVDTAQREGLSAAIHKVQSRLDNWKTPGYSAAGTVIEVGEGVSGFKVGDRVTCGGQDRAGHADYVSVPANLCALIPDGVDFRQACYTTVGAIALHGIRQADVRVGETAAVIGLGLVGQLTVQILKASGCRVVGIDVNAAAADLALKSGADRVAVRGRDDVAALVAAFTRGLGADAILITAATDSNDPIELAAAIARDRATVVMVGVTGMELPRDLYFGKELQFRLSRSYGPGRYDRRYEEEGIDYPAGYVRWTEGRNFEAFLDLIAGGRLDLDLLTTHTFPIEDAARAYDLITGKLPGERFVGVLIEYPGAPLEPASRRITLDGSQPARPGSAAERVVLGVIGAGNYAQDMLLPHLRGRSEVDLRIVSTGSGVTARKVAERAGFQAAASDAAEVLADPEVNAVLIATRHHLHARYVVEALRRGKAVFVEKPLVMTRAELEEVAAALAETAGRLMVGFNRRFAPTAREAREFMAASPNQTILYRVNAGPLPQNHWLRDPAQGGGRLLGEGCHFIDFVQYLSGAPVRRVYARSLGGGTADAGDSFALTLGLAGGSLGTILYTAVGDTSLAKERVETFGGGRTAIIDDFRSGRLISGGKSRPIGGKGQDKGQAAEMEAFVSMALGRTPPPIPPAELLTGAAATLAALESLRTGAEVAVE